MNLKSLCLAALLPMMILLTGCQQDTTPTTPTDADPQAEAIGRGTRPAAGGYGSSEASAARPRGRSKRSRIVQ